MRLLVCLAGLCLTQPASALQWEVGTDENLRGKHHGKRLAEKTSHVLPVERWQNARERIMHSHSLQKPEEIASGPAAWMSVAASDVIFGCSKSLAYVFGLSKTPTESEQWVIDQEVILEREWYHMCVGLAAMFLMDGLILQRLPITFGWNLLKLGVSILGAVVYNLVIFETHGSEAALMFWSSYVLEWLLSLDNLFVFLLVFKAYKTPVESASKVLSCWIPFGIAIRLAMYTVLTAAFDELGVLKVFGGLYAIYSGMIAVNDQDDDLNMSDLVVVRFFHGICGDRLVDEYDKDSRMFVVKDGQLKGTILNIVFISLVVVDCIFAFDSVSAKVTQIPNKYIACSSTMMALFAMRNFVVFLEYLVRSFDLLKYGIAAILIFIGIQLVVAGLAPGATMMDPVDTMMIIVFFLFSSILTSAAAPYLLGGAWAPQSPKAKLDDGIVSEKIPSAKLQ